MITHIHPEMSTEERKKAVCRILSEIIRQEENENRKFDIEKESGGWYNSIIPAAPEEK